MNEDTKETIGLALMVIGLVGLIIVMGIGVSIIGKVTTLPSLSPSASGGVYMGAGVLAIIVGVILYKPWNKY